MWLLIQPEVSTARLLHSLTTRLVSSLAADNQHSSSTEQLRLRIVLHAGELLQDPYGHTGASFNHAARLLDAEAARTLLAASPAAAAVLVVSDVVYEGTVRHGYHGSYPAAWQPIRVHAKETMTRAWVHLPGLVRQPELPAVLAAAPVGPARLPIPRELPATPEAFVGRDEELHQLARWLNASSPVARLVAISAIDGMGGIGKSALAIQAGHHLAEQFPDGQLYVNLHGATPGHPPVAPLDALARILRSLGVDPSAIPVEVDEAAARWRSLAAWWCSTMPAAASRFAHCCQPVRPVRRCSPAAKSLRLWTMSAHCTWICCHPSRRWSCLAGWRVRSGSGRSLRRLMRWFGAAACCRWRSGSLAPG